MLSATAKALRALGRSPAATLVVSAAIVAASVGIFGFSGWSLGVPLVAIAAVLTWGVAWPASSLYYPTISHGARDRQRVALSFDDGPDPETTPQVLDVLARHGARATFFVIGRKLAAQPELARRMLAEGHELGNHSWRHSRFQNLRGARFNQREIERCTEAIVTTGQKGEPLFRSPIGLKSPHLAHAAQRLGIGFIVAWSLHGRDTRSNDPEHIARRVLKKVRPGDIILLHDGHDLPDRHRLACAPAVELILQGLKSRGLQPVTVSILLGLSTANKEKTGLIS